MPVNDDELERLALDEQIQQRKRTDSEAREAAKKHTAKIQSAGVWYRLFSNILKVVTTSLKIAHDSIGVAASLIPPVNAVISGMFATIDLVEALFISEETKNRRAVKGVTATISIGLTITSTIMVLNPATAPIGAALLAGAMLVSTLKEGFFWYKTNKDVRRAKAALAVAKMNSPADEKQITELTEKVKSCRAIRNSRRQSFFYNALSLIGTILLAISAFALVGSIVANPFTLGVLGLVAIGIATVASVRNKIKSGKVVTIQEAEKLAEKIPTTPKPIIKQEDTQHIVDELITKKSSIPQADIKTAEKKALLSIRSQLHESEPTPSTRVNSTPPEKKHSPGPSSKKPEEDDSESESNHPHR